MKILIEFLGQIESGPVFSYELAKGLLENGVDVYVLLNAKVENKNKWKDTFENDHVYFYSSILSKRRPVSSIHKLYTEILAIRKKFIGIEFDYIIRPFTSKYNDILIRGIRYSKIINFCHDPIEHSGVSPKVVKKNKKMIKKCDKIVVLTKSFISVVEDKYNKDFKDIIYIRHGILPYNENNGIHTRFRTEKDNVKFLFFGRIDSYKGIKVLIDAYTAVEEKYDNVELLIAGKGDLSLYEEDLHGLRNLTLINRYVKANEVDEIFRLDNIVLVLPYKDATQSGVATIAFEYCVPVIASDIGGLKEQMFDGEVGTFVLPNNVNELEKAMILFLNDSNYYDTEAHKMEKMCELLSWNNIALELISQLD